jgi:hypothetical protein
MTNASTDSVGNEVTATSGSLIIEHTTNGGISSILFPSKSDSGNDYGYIQYQDTTGLPNTQSGLLKIGIENDSTSTNGPDRISLFACGGLGYVGINTTTPQYSLDVSGNLNVLTAITASSLDTGIGTINGGAITASSLDTGEGTINAGAITASSLSTQGGSINGGAIVASSLSTTGAITASSLSTTGAITASSMTVGGTNNATIDVAGNINAKVITCTSLTSGSTVSINFGSITVGANVISTGSGNIDVSDNIFSNDDNKNNDVDDAVGDNVLYASSNID